ncbi:UBIQUITIN CARBOXYL-TERMINAL HYDROLASE [Salix purpurea]|uniref:Ubiquitin carboxyl-terminal hydrolase 26 n=1 Tax=Salix purpurea TaxID=77065 RepID=A0A9Q0PBR9_SALPP|nr:UBIQUITIN CARBOXYL-TERMINAL HYDROLASE [Salix purpurea]
MPDILQAIGPDPVKDLRNTDETPAGLTNLGATCYANSVLQCLYMNASFREIVFSAEPDLLNEQPVLNQLARLFAQLHASKMAVIDPAPFIMTLELDNAVQQDGHEFLTLLLSLLERCLSHSKISKVKKAVQDLFRGSVSQVTTCSKCGRDSEASSKTEDFYELELNVKGLKNLDESLDQYLSVEQLHGENQYNCELCKSTVDATHRIRLRTLPDVLNFQLKRYEFLPKTTTRKKITSAFGFPGELDMGLRLSEPSQLEWIYDLSAVLIHKGTAVNSGHYIAHIKDENTGQWWAFDDEHVSNLGHCPFGEGSSSCTAKVVHNDNTVLPSCVGTTPADTSRSHVDVVLPQSLESNVVSHKDSFSSVDAYRLMYNLKRTRKNDDKRIHIANNIQLEGHKGLHNGFPLPPHLFEDLKDVNAAYLAVCEEYKLKREREQHHIAERRQEVRSILSEAPVRSLEEPFYWVSTAWLRQWADNVIPGVIDNKPIQCSHGEVPVSKIGCMKRLSVKAWEILFSKYDGGPALSNSNYCMTCLIDGAQSVVSADSYRDQRILMRDLANDVIAKKCSDGAYFVSKTWLQQWVRRKNIDAPSEADAEPTASIRCRHGQLKPEQPGAKRLLVPEKLWLFLYKDAVAVKPVDPLGCTTFPSDSELCPECSDELSEVACFEDSLREIKLRHRQNHEKLAAGKGIPLSLNCTYYLMPSSWLTKWRNYTSGSGKNTSSSVEPEVLDPVIDALKCEQHSRLLERPPDLMNKRGMLIQKSSSTDALTIITENDWISFCEEWGGNKEKGIMAIIESSDVAESNLGGCGEDMPRCKDHPSSQDEASNDSEIRQPVIRTTPEICEDCIGEQKSHELAKKLNYFNEDISVSLVRGKEAPRSILEASSATSETDRRASKRSRKTSYGTSVNLKVSGSTSLYRLKMMIWELLGVVKENQILHKGSMIIDQESATLADLSIFPGDKLWVQDSEIHEHRDIADEIADQKANAQDPEKGCFHDTLDSFGINILEGRPECLTCIVEEPVQTRFGLPGVEIFFKTCLTLLTCSHNRCK